VIETMTARTQRACAIRGTDTKIPHLPDHDKESTMETEQLTDAINTGLTTRLDIGATTPEPTIKEMISHYYTSHGIDEATAQRYKERICKALVGAITDQLAEARPVHSGP
jgi:hypothetical protein